MDLPLPAAVARVPWGPAGAAGSAGMSEAERRGIREVAQEFESLLLLQMIKQMRQTFLEEPSEEQGFGNETMTETIDVELAKSLARQGGLGLADSIERSLARAVGAPAAGPGVVDGSTQSVAVPTRAAAVVPATAPGQAPLRVAEPEGQGETALSQWSGVAEREPGESGVPDLDLPLSDRVSSAFGWRIDPFHGAKRFHAGIDFAAAYGRPVPVAAPGRVVEAGAEGGYGMTVVVDHGAGVQTRYAHLSYVTVEVGQELARAEVVGRVGQSGRATGPHLHFEVALNGRKVDPALAASRVPGGLKFPGDVVDSSVDGVPVGQPAVE